MRASPPIASDCSSVGGPITSTRTPGRTLSSPSLAPKLAYTCRFPIVARLRTAARLPRFVSPRKRSCAVISAGTSGAASSRGSSFSTAPANACMFESCATSARERSAVPLRAGARAAGSRPGSSVHGWSTTSGASERMIEPERRANPERWSECRCVATTTSSLPPQSALICSAIAGIRFSGVNGEYSEEPKSISTLRSSPPA